MVASKHVRGHKHVTALAVFGVVYPADAPEPCPPHGLDVFVPFADPPPAAVFARLLHGTWAERKVSAR